MSVGRHVYTSHDDDNLRWDGFPFRDGDIVVSTRSKCGTTWVQMICALLIHQTPDLPHPLAVLSPWVDWRGEPLPAVLERLAAQDHRRVLKTHTPLDGLPIDPRATYIVVGRDPLDVAVSLYHHGRNIDRERLSALTGTPSTSGSSVVPLQEWVRRWIEQDNDPRAILDSLPGLVMHVQQAWERRAEPNQLLLHYDDLAADLDGSMRRLATDLQIAVPEARWPELVDAASFAAMSGRAEELAPDPFGIFRDRAAFFRRGRSGAGRELLGEDEYAAYRARVGELASPDLAGWLLRDDAASYPD